MATTHSSTLTAVVNLTSGSVASDSVINGHLPMGSAATAAHAACSGLGVSMFFSDNFDDIAAAKMLCLQCPIRGQCLDLAVARSEQYGVWGGQLFEAGRIVIAKRRRGRPAKVARPGDTLPEVAVPARYQCLVVAF